MSYLGRQLNAPASTVELTAGGAITAGKPVVIVPPGASVGSAVDFESGATKDVASVYDSSNNRIVIAYGAGGGENGTAVVGTVSGSSITFGTPVVFESSKSSKISIAFDSNANKVVIAY